MKHFNLKTKYPQNALFKNPLIGGFVLFVFSFGFMLLYHPLNAHKSFYFGFEFTMFFYTLSASLSGGLLIFLLKKLSFFSKTEQWTLGKELLAIYIVLQVLGVVIYFLGFVIEEPAVKSRWNFYTFLDSCKASFLIYAFPFVFFSSVNYKFLFLRFESTIRNFDEEKQATLTVKISSKLKKESLSFEANQLLFAVSEGNYVIFHLCENEKTKKTPIRNSITNIEYQLKEIPFFFRCHRGFIVNLNMIESKKGNASGYLLNIKHSKDTIPISRKYAKSFTKLMDSSYN